MLEKDPFELPAYGSRQAAHYVGLPYTTVRTWVGTRGLITPASPSALSFNNLTELHVLKAMRRTHKLSLQSIRKALAELGSYRHTPHPLLDETFGTDGVRLYLLEAEQVVNLNQQLQTEIRQCAELYLQRIERDRKGHITKLFPFVTRAEYDEPRNVSISPKIAFGQPVLAGTGVSTAVIAGRFAARDTVSELAEEYGVSAAVLEDAIRWELLKGKAA